MRFFDEIEEYENLNGKVQGFGIDENDNDDIQEFDDDDSDFDNSVMDMDFSEIRGDFKKTLSKVNRKLNQKSSQAKTQRFISKGKSKPLSKEIPVNRSAKIHGSKQKKISRVIVPNDQRVIVEGVNKFILSKDPKDDAIKNIGYHNGKKLNELVLIFNNNSGVDFDLEVFNPSQPLDYLYATSLNLNDKVQVAGGAVSYSDVLFNLLANPALIYNAKFVFAGPSMVQQISEPLIFKNKSIAGVEKVAPLNLSLQVDNMQVANDIVFFDVCANLNRPFIPDGMDVIKYNIKAGNSVTMAFFYKQISLKKVFFEEARASKKLL